MRRKHTCLGWSIALPGRGVHHRKGWKADGEGFANRQRRRANTAWVLAGAIRGARGFRPHGRGGDRNTVFKPAVRILLDTHLLLWAAAMPDKLSAEIRELIEAPLTTPLFSAASIWEVSIKGGWAGRFHRRPLAAPGGDGQERLRGTGHHRQPCRGAHCSAMHCWTRGPACNVARTSTSHKMKDPLDQPGTHL